MNVTIFLVFTLWCIPTGCIGQIGYSQDDSQENDGHRDDSGGDQRGSEIFSRQGKTNTLNDEIKNISDGKQGGSGGLRRRRRDANGGGDSADGEGYGSESGGGYIGRQVRGSVKGGGNEGGGGGNYVQRINGYGQRNGNDGDGGGYGTARGEENRNGGGGGGFTGGGGGSGGGSGGGGGYGQGINEYGYGQRNVSGFGHVGKQDGRNGRGRGGHGEGRNGSYLPDISNSSILSRIFAQPRQQFSDTKKLIPVYKSPVPV